MFRIELMSILSKLFYPNTNVIMSKSQLFHVRWQLRIKCARVRESGNSIYLIKLFTLKAASNLKEKIKKDLMSSTRMQRVLGYHLFIHNMAFLVYVFFIHNTCTEGNNLKSLLMPKVKNQRTLLTELLKEAKLKVNIVVLLRGHTLFLLLFSSRLQKQKKHML